MYLCVSVRRDLSVRSSDRSKPHQLAIVRTCELARVAVAAARGQLPGFLD